MATILSITFDINGKRETGLKFLGLVLDSCLSNGFNLAILHSLGKSPEDMEVLQTSAIGFAGIFAPYFKNLLKPYQFLLSTIFSLVKVRLKLTFSSSLL